MTVRESAAKNRRFVILRHADASIPAESLGTTFAAIETGVSSLLLTFLHGGEDRRAFESNALRPGWRRGSWLLEGRVHKYGVIRPRLESFVTASCCHDAAEGLAHIRQANTRHRRYSPEQAALARVAAGVSEKRHPERQCGIVLEPQLEHHELVYAETDKARLYPRGGRRELDERDLRDERLHQDLGRWPVQRNPKLIGTNDVVVGLVCA
jgi:hypothetical protein